jgi:predicted dehydrogenase
MSSVRWGIAGPGRIAEKVAADFAHVPDAELVAVGSRSAQRAGEFAARHGIARALGSYADLVADAGVDAVYIATPHPQHRALAVACLDAGKAVLVEKAFTATVAGAESVVEASQSRGVFAMEAMWTRFQPAMTVLRGWVDDGAIGEVRGVQADLGVVREFDPSDRLFAPELGGGALLDLGVYVVSFAQWLLGVPSRVRCAGTLGRSGVEEEASLLVEFVSGATATLSTSLHSPMPGQARVFGTGGWIDVLPRFHHPDTVILHRPDAEPERVTRAPTGGGYSHELAEVTEGVLAGRAESAVMPLADTLTVQRILEDAAAQLGITWAEDDSVL